MWSSVFRSVIQTYLPTCLTVFALIKAAFETHSLDVIKSMSSFIKFSLVLFIPVFSVLYLKGRQHMLEQDHYKIRYGTLYRNVQTSNSAALYTNFVFCFRRFILTFATVFFGKWLFLQIIVYTYTTLFQACFFISVKPMN